MERVRLQDRKELKEFTNTNTVKGTEKKDAVLKALGLIQKNSPASVVPKYIKRNGVVYKMVDGVAIELKKVVK